MQRDHDSSKLLVKFTRRKDGKTSYIFNTTILYFGLGIYFVRVEIISLLVQYHMVSITHHLIISLISRTITTTSIRYKNGGYG